MCHNIIFGIKSQYTLPGLIASDKKARPESGHTSISIDIMRVLMYNRGMTSIQVVVEAIRYSTTIARALARKADEV